MKRKPSLAHRPFLKILLGGAAVAVLILAIAAPFAHAQISGDDASRGGNEQTTSGLLDLVADCNVDVFCYMRRFFYWVVLAVQSLIIWVTTALMSFAGLLIQGIIKLNTTILGHRYILTGFGLTLNLANMGLVFAAVLIALATILGFERYQLKATLPKLIFAAILINFSLGIAGVFIDFSNILGSYFIGRATDTGDIIDFSSNIVNALQVQTLFNINSNPAESQASFMSLLELGADFVRHAITLFFTMVFCILVLIVLFAIGIMLLIRYLVLGILIILMPIAWLFWVIPNLQGEWDRWWKEFIRWCFFLPACAFFLYLSIVSAQKIGSDIRAETQNLPQNQGMSDIIITEHGLPDFLAVFIQLALLAASIIVANNMGITGAKAAKGVMDKFVGGITGGKARQKALGKFAEKVGERVRGVTTRFATAPFRLAAQARPVQKGAQAVKRQFSKTTTTDPAEIERLVRARQISLDKVLSVANSKWLQAGGNIPGLEFLGRIQAAHLLALARLRNKDTIVPGGGMELVEGGITAEGPEEYRAFTPGETKALNKKIAMAKAQALSRRKNEKRKKKEEESKGSGGGEKKLKELEERVEGLEEKTSS